jgi:hypothetical protein
MNLKEKSCKIGFASFAKFLIRAGKIQFKNWPAVVAAK